MVSNLLASSTEYPNSNAVLAKLALKADAANPVFTGDLTISGATPRLYFVDTDQNPDYTIFVDSGYFYIYDQTAGATKFQITPSGNAINAGTLTSTSFIKSGGTASQFLMADGSVTTGVANPVGGTGTTGYHAKWTSASTIGNGIIYDSGSKIGIGTATPYGLVEINGNGNAWETAPAIRMWDTLNSKGWLIGTVNNYAAGDFYIRTLPSINTNPGSTELQFIIKHSTGNILINTSTDAGYKLDVNGTARFNGQLTGTGASFSSSLSVTIGGAGISLTGTSGSNSYYVMDQTPNSGGKRWRFGHTGAIGGFGSFDFYNQTDDITPLTLASTGAATFSKIVTTKSVGDYRQSTSGAITGAGLFVTPASAGTYGLLIGSSYTYGDVWLQAGRIDGNTQNYNISLNASGGNVIIGTTTDAGFKFDVNGTGRFQGALSFPGGDRGFECSVSGSLSIYNNEINAGSQGVTGSLYFGWRRTTALNFGVASNFSSTITATNNITVTASSNTIAPQFVMSQTGGNTYSAIGINRADGTGIAAGIGSALVLRSGDATDTPIQFATANNVRMTITANGNLGIGTASPNAVKVEILQSVSGNPVLGTASGNLMLSQNGLWGMFFGLNGSTGNGWIQQMRADSATAYNLMLQVVGGNVLVGTVLDLGYKLQVSGSIVSRENGTAEFRAQGGGYAGNYNTSLRSIAGATGVLQFGNNGDNYILAGNTATGGNLQIRVNCNSESIASGTAALTFANSAAATFFSSVTATSFFESSDSRLKTLIDGSAQIAGIENLQAKLYQKNGKLEFGYFAQDAEKFMPYAITKETDGFLSLSYREVHTAKIARLEQRVAELEKQLNAA